MVSVASRKVSRAPRYSGISFESGSFSPTWLSHSMAPLSRGLRLTIRLVTLLLPTLQPLCHPKVIQVWANSDFARHYFRNRGFFLFLQVLRWFTSLGWLVLPYEFRQSYIGFPHSDIDGSMDKCSSPSLFAAFHVLHRLQVPRHSPHALSSLTIKLVHQQIFLYSLDVNQARTQPPIKTHK